MSDNGSDDNDNDRDGHVGLLVTRTERGWPGHLIVAEACLYRRNTLLECGEMRIVVSTVGAYKYNDQLREIGAFGRYYETMAFEAKRNGPYWDADVHEQVLLSDRWCICAESAEALPEEVDLLADQMHEANVAELSQRLADSALTPSRSKA